MRLPREVELAYCPTGEGGGIDNSCSPANAGSAAIFSPGLKRELGFPQELEPVAQATASLSTTLSQVAQRAVNVDASHRLAQELEEIRVRTRQSRTRLNHDPANQQLRDEFNANVRAMNAARRRLEAHQIATNVMTPPTIASLLPVVQEQNQTEVQSVEQVQQEIRQIEQQTVRVQRARRALSRVHQRIADSAADIQIDEITPQEAALASGNRIFPPIVRALNHRSYEDVDFPSEQLNKWSVAIDARSSDPSSARYINASYAFKTPSDRLFKITMTGDPLALNDYPMDLIFTDDSGSTSRTGRGEAFHVFSQVVPAVKAFIDKYKPKKIKYTAAQESRFDLYDKLTATVQALSPGTYKKFVSRERGPDNPFIMRLPDGTVRRTRGGGGITLIRQ